MMRTPWALLVAVSSLFLAAGCRRTPEPPLPAVTVEAVYPGANAQVVADTIAAPIEAQVNGVEGLVHLQSRSADDGSYTLTVTFRRGTDLDVAQVLVQNRVALAEPALPDLVKRHGLTVKKASPGVLLLVSLYSPDNSRSDVYLSNYASKNVKDELARVPGVWDVALFGARDYAVRLWLDPDRLAARGLTTADVVQALQEQNLQPAADPVGEQPAGDGPIKLSVSLLGRVADVDQLGNIILKTDGEGRKVRLRDVGRVEVGAARDGRVSLDGKPGVALGVYPAAKVSPRTVTNAVEKRLAELKERFPEGLDRAAFDFTPNFEAPGQSTNPEYLLVDVTLPAAASAQRTEDALRRCDQVARATAGVQHTMALTDNPFDRTRNRPCLLVALAAADGKRPGREQVLADLRARLEKELPAVRVRLRDLAGPARFPRCGYPVDLAVSGPDVVEVRKLAEKLAERLGRDARLTDVLADPAATPRPQLSLVIDRAQAKDRSVALQDVLTTLEAALGSYYVNDFERFGRTWQVQVQARDEHRASVDDLKQLKVRNSQGEMVPLAAFASIRQTEGPAAVDRLDLQSMAEITANPAPGVSPAQVRTLCETAAEEVRKELGLSAEYRLTWLSEMSAAK